MLNTRRFVFIVAVLSASCTQSPNPSNQREQNLPGDGQGSFASETLRVAMPPGRIEDFRHIFGSPFEEQTGASVEIVGLRSADQVARVRIEGSSPSLDVLWIDYGEALVLAKESLLALVDESSVPNLSAIQPSARSELGIAPVTFSSALGFLVNTERVPEPPTSWRSLFSPRYASELALFDFGSTLGPMTLVMAARLNGGGEGDIEPGFEALRKLAPSVRMFRSSGPQNNLMVAQGEAGITLALASQSLDLRDKGAPVEWLIPEEGAIGLPQGFQIVASSARRRLAEAFVNFALSKDVQSELAEQLLLVATREDIELSAEATTLVPLGRTLYFDLETIGRSRGQWTDRFNREILTAVP